MAIDKGMFNFQGIMDEFYGFSPDGKDDGGRAMKDSFMANMVQSGFDASLAKDMAHTQSGIAKDNMLQAADLDLRNKAALMNDEFNKGMLNMGGQFEFQNRFAEDQTVRDITKDTTQGATQFEFQNKFQENQNVRDTTKDSMERADNYEYANRGAENQGVRDTQNNAINLGAQFDYADKMADNQNVRDMAKIGFTADEGRKTIAETGKQNRLGTITEGEQSRYGMMQQGAENRETMREGDRIEAGKQNRQSARSRATARAF